MSDEEQQEKEQVIDRLYMTIRHIWWYLFQPPLKLREDEYDRILCWYLDLPPAMLSGADDSLADKISDYLHDVEPPKYTDMGGCVENPPTTMPNPFTKKERKV